MGNAMEFLKDQKKQKKYRKGNHDAECKVKIDKFLETNEITKCDNQTLIAKGNSNSHRVNEKVYYESSIPGVHSRNQHKKKEEICESCGDKFKPEKVKRQLKVSEIESGLKKATIWCPLCRGKGTQYRRTISSLGREEFHRLNNIPQNQEALAKAGDNMYEIEHIRTTRLLLDRGTKRVDMFLETAIRIIWEKKEVLDARASQPEFDF